jgi:general nucleoside transport system permease protein
LAFPGTIRFNEYAILPQIWPDAGRAHWGFVFALIAAVAVWFMLSRMLKGFEVRVLGQSPRAGRFAGFSSKNAAWDACGALKKKKIACYAVQQ